MLSDLVTCVNIFVYLPSPPHPSDLLQNPLIVPVKILKGHRVTGELGECIVVAVALFCGASSNNSFGISRGNGNVCLTIYLMIEEVTVLPIKRLKARSQVRHKHKHKDIHTISMNTRMFTRVR